MPFSLRVRNDCMITVRTQEIQSAKDKVVFTSSIKGFVELNLQCIGSDSIIKHYTFNLRVFEYYNEWSFGALPRVKCYKQEAYVSPNI